MIVSAKRMLCTVYSKPTCLVFPNNLLTLLLKSLGILLNKTISYIFLKVVMVSSTNLRTFENEKKIRALLNVKASKAENYPKQLLFMSKHSQP